MTVSTWQNDTFRGLVVGVSTRIIMEAKKRALADVDALGGSSSLNPEA